MSLGTGLLVAVLIARLLLPRAARALAKHASTELYQLTIVSFCLCSGWVSGYMVCAGAPSTGRYSELPYSFSVCGTLTSSPERHTSC